MLGTQIAFTVVSAIAALVIAYSTWSFHQWTKNQHYPDPILTRKDVGTDAIDKEHANVKVQMEFFNTGTMPLYIERISMGLVGILPHIHKTLAPEQGLVPPDCLKSVGITQSFERSELTSRSEAIVWVQFRVGIRSGALLYRGFRVPSTQDLGSLEAAGLPGEVKLLTFGGKGDEACIPAYSFTYPTSAIGKQIYRARRKLGLSPGKKFNTWTKARGDEISG